jgi:hypothetical protein
MSFLSDFSVLGDEGIVTLGFAVCHVTSPCRLYGLNARLGRLIKSSERVIEGQQPPT